MILGSLAAAGGGIGYFAFPLGLNIGVKSMINLKENGMIYPLYMNPPFGTKSEFRLFSIQNPKYVNKAKVFSIINIFVHNIANNWLTQQGGS